MEHVDTLICGRWILPIEPFAHVLEHHALAIRQGRIVAIAPTAAALGRFAAADVIERPHHVLLPGLVNIHTRVAMTLLRGAVPSVTFAAWGKHIQSHEQRWMDAGYVRDATQLAIADMLCSGTTCFADMHLYPEVVAQTASAARMRACVGLPVLDAPSAWADGAGEYFDKGLQLHDDYRDDPLITTALAAFAPHAVSDATLRRAQRAADELEIPVMMPVNQTREDASLQRLERLGMLSPLLAAIHMVHVDESLLDGLAASGINVAHCPQFNLRLGNGLCPVPDLLAAGLNVGLGTGTAAGHAALDLFDEMRLAALVAGLSGHAHAAPAADLPAHHWLRMATLHGARALGLADVIGSLVPGKWADLCCVDLHGVHAQPVYDPAAQLVDGAARAQVTDVWVAGRPLVRERHLTQMDTHDILERAAAWQQRIAGAQSF